MSSFTLEQPETHKHNDIYYLMTRIVSQNSSYKTIQATTIKGKLTLTDTIIVTALKTESSKQSTAAYEWPTAADTYTVHESNASLTICHALTTLTEQFLYA
jgi:hypothetical protein